jgi:hypothetical protein
MRIQSAGLIFIAIVTCAGSSGAQTRLFLPGDSGAAASFDLAGTNTNDQREAYNMLRVSYGHRGAWDLGLAYGNLQRDLSQPDKWAVNGAFVVLSAGSQGGLGLEINGSYWDYESDSDLAPVRTVFPAGAQAMRYRNVQPGVRCFYRPGDAGHTAGINLFCQFRKTELIGGGDEVLWGHDKVEPGIRAAFESAAGRLFYWSVAVETIRDVDTAVVVSAGCLFGRDSRTGGDSHGD